MKKPIFNLTPEEQETEDELERGDYVSVPATIADKEEWVFLARHTLEKTKAINIRLTEKSFGSGHSESWVSWKSW